MAVTIASLRSWGQHFKNVFEMLAGYMPLVVGRLPRRRCPGRLRESVRDQTERDHAALVAASGGGTDRAAAKAGTNRPAMQHRLQILRFRWRILASPAWWRNLLM